MTKVWFITGAGSGIGAGVVRAALAAGDRVVATGRSLDKVRAAFPEADYTLAGQYDLAGAHRFADRAAR